MKKNDESRIAEAREKEAPESRSLNIGREAPLESPFPPACALPPPVARGKAIKLQTYMVYMILPMVLIPILLMALMGIWLSFRSAQSVNQWFLQSRESELLMIAERELFFQRRKAEVGMLMGSAEIRMKYFRQWLQQFIERSNRYETIYLWIHAVDAEGKEILRVLANETKLSEEEKNRLLSQISQCSEIVPRTKTMKAGATYCHAVGSTQIISVPIWFDQDENGQLSPNEYLGALTAAFQYPSSYIMFVVMGMLATTGFIMALALLVFFTVKRRFRRLIDPIGHLAQMARRFARGDLSARANVHLNVSEVQDMVDAFNTMACDIENILEERNRYARELAKLNEGLEQKVLERTRELRRLNKELRAANRHKSEFLANMSHELRTPLNAILGFTELIQDGIYGQMQPKMTEIMEKIQRNGTHLLNLINDVLDLSKIEAGHIELTLADFHPSACIENVASNASSLAARKGLKVTTDIPKELPTGYGDEKRVNQILWNLVSNAIKFTQNGEVTIGVKAEDGGLHFFVKDTGMGIPADRMGDLFKEFTQLNSSNTKEFGGTGLGLSISRKLAEMHGGLIWAESEEGKGSVFHFTLPFNNQANLGSSSDVEQGARMEGK